jgi:small subunit ribosomal protein S21
LANKHIEQYARDELRLKGMQVYVKNNDVGGAIRKFKKRVQEEGIIQEFRNRKEYIKPSQQRKRAKAAGRARHLKKVRKELAIRGF